MQWKLTQGNFDGAITVANSVISAGPTDEYWVNAQTILVSAYLGKGDISSAENIYEQMKTRGNSINTYSTSHLAELINMVTVWGGTTPKISSLEGNKPDNGVTKKPIPTSYSLSGNYQNPFNPTTTIQYALPEDGKVLLKVFNVLGMEIKTLVDEYQAAGYKSISFDANNLPSGIYFYRIQAGSFSDVKKFVLLK